MWNLLGKKSQVKTTKWPYRINQILALATRWFLSCTGKYVVVNIEPYFSRKVHEVMAELN
jgi:hypothetical protein